MPTSDDAFVHRVAEAIASGVAVEAGDGSAAIDTDTQRLDALLRGGDSVSGWRLWTNSQCLVTTRRFAATPRFADAALASTRRGWPVFVRVSGGTTVVHRPGILNASYFEAWRGDGGEVTRRFRIFCEHLATSIRSVGVSTCLGHVDGSYCDGSLNLVSGGQKLAGTASLVRRRGDTIGLLSHASIGVTGQVAVDVEAIERFEAELGFQPSYSEDVHTTLEQRLMSAPARADP
ncbi:hypothetical protein [Sphingopyxis sp. KK2]|uniref:lipoyl protein ligase domain-containing protein n=1 Tax=Sphingopyxis sp. KK2 TaxID=1855727 RepID=UPI001181A31B|nr:hypothetical protein [Sphingopyxis sp. KK2]